MKQLIVCLFFILWNTLLCAQIYTVPHQFIFNAVYYQKENNITSEEIITFTTTGLPWKADSQQVEGVWKYTAKKKTKKLFVGQKSLAWTDSSPTGVIENNDKTWLHPPRQNQYMLTEIAPFPECRKDYKTGQGFTTLLQINFGWGDWDGKEIYFDYKVTNITVNTGDTLWTIAASSELEKKKNTCTFIFNNKKGFTLLEYHFYNGDTLIMKLQEE